MQKVDFFTPVSFTSTSQCKWQGVRESIDNYFYLGGKKAYILNTQNHGERATFSQDSISMVSTALKICSYCTVVIPLLMLLFKYISRSAEDFILLDVKQKLETGIALSEQTKIKLKELMPKILTQEKDEEIIWHKGNNLVFSLKSNPTLIFKMGHPDFLTRRGPRTLTPSELIKERFANMVKAKEVCLAHELDQLLIPNAKQFDLQIADKTYSLIAEEKLELKDNQESQYQELSGLNESVKQLTTFIAKTGFSDVDCRNIPVYDDAPGNHPTRRIALIDVEEMTDPAEGIFGSFSRKGLIRSLGTEEQIDIVLAEAKRLNITSLTSPEEIKAGRMKELKTGQKAQIFYALKGIHENERKPIPKISQAALPVKKAFDTVIELINESISKSSEIGSIQNKRHVFLNFQDERLLPFKPELILKIVEIMVNKGHIIQVIKTNGHGIHLQA